MPTDVLDLLGDSLFLVMPPAILVLSQYLPVFWHVFDINRAVVWKNIIWSSLILAFFTGLLALFHPVWGNLTLIGTFSFSVQWEECRDSLRGLRNKQNGTSSNHAQTLWLHRNWEWINTDYGIYAFSLFLWHLPIVQPLNLVGVLWVRTNNKLKSE